MARLRNRRRMLLLGAQDATYADDILSETPSALWMLDETSGTEADDSTSNDFDGVATGVTWADAVAPWGLSVPLLDGANDFVNIFQALTDMSFDTTLFSLVLWVKVSGVGVWTDAAVRRGMYLFADNSNRIIIQKDSASNVFNYFYIAGGTSKSVSKSSVTSTDWIHTALTVDVGNDRMRAYFNGTQEGVDQTSLGTWAGSLHSAATIIGATNTTPLNVWDGWIGAVGIWSGTELTAAQISTLYNGGL